MVSFRSSRTFIYLLAGSVALMISGIFMVYGSRAAVACLDSSLSGQIIGFLDLDYRLLSVGWDEVAYYDGCTGVSLRTITLIPEAIGLLSFLALVSYPARDPLPGVANRINTVLVVLGALGLIFVSLVGYVPMYVGLVLVGFVAIMRSHW